MDVILAKTHVKILAKVHAKHRVKDLAKLDAKSHVNQLVKEVIKDLAVEVSHQHPVE